MFLEYILLCCFVQEKRNSLTENDLGQEMRHGEDEQVKITSFEEMFRRIKEATGVSDTKVR